LVTLAVTASTVRRLTILTLRNSTSSLVEDLRRRNVQDALEIGPKT
jgi:hypothetical protein